MEFFYEGLFSTKKVRDFPFPEREIIEVKSTDTVDSAFRLLVEHKILSAPCWDEEKGKYLGFFDITDALALIYSVDLLITAIPDSMLKTSTALRLASSGSACPDCSDLLVGSLFDDVSAGQSDGMRSERDASWNPVTAEAPMSQVIFLLATSTRRVPVINPDTGRVTKILSQSLVTQVLNDTLKEMEARGDPLPELFQKTPRNSGGFGIRPVLTVDADHNTARDAFRKIIENGVSAVAVLDEDGKLLSSITTKDIRLFKSMEEAAMQRLNAEKSKRDSESDRNPKEHLALMDLTCGDFVSMVELTATNKGITMAPAVVVDQDAPIRKMIARLALTKKHRLFICDDRHPIGIVSVSDIAKLLVTDPNKKE